MDTEANTVARVDRQPPGNGTPTDERAVARGVFNWLAQTTIADRDLDFVPAPNHAYQSRLSYLNTYARRGKYYKLWLLARGTYGEPENVAPDD